MSVHGNPRIVDLSHSLSSATPAFPGDPSLQVRILDSAATPSTAGERHLNSSHLSMGLHCGTHMDAPFHFFDDRASIDQVALSRCIGPAFVVRYAADVHGPSIGPEHLKEHESRLRATRRVIFNTLWHHRWGSGNYFTEHPVISAEGARFLVDCGVALVGVDTPSVDRAPFPAHLALLGNDVLIVENLTNLDELGGANFELIATPLKISGRDGSPVRALAIVS